MAPNFLTTLLTPFLSLVIPVTVSKVPVPDIGVRLPTPSKPVLPSKTPDTIASLFALITGVGLLIAYQITGNASFVIAAPVASAGVGGSFALVPIGERARGTVRQASAILAALVMTYLFRVDDVIYAIVSPLIALPVLGIADRFFDRGKEVVDEDLAGDSGPDV